MLGMQLKAVAVKSKQFLHNTLYKTSAACIHAAVGPTIHVGI